MGKIFGDIATFGYELIKVSLNEKQDDAETYCYEPFHCVKLLLITAGIELLANIFALVVGGVVIHGTAALRNIPGMFAE